MHLERLLIDLGLHNDNHRLRGTMFDKSPDVIAFVEHVLNKRKLGEPIGKLSVHEKAMLYAAARSATYVYFVLAEDAGMVKIGQSRRPKSRLHDLRIGSPVKLRLLFAFLALKSTERMIHEYLARSRSHGEWFRLDGDVLAMMDTAAEHGLKGVMDAIGYESGKSELTYLHEHGMIACNSGDLRP